MPRSTGVSVENNFTKGLITEASALNFPENACTDTVNCIFKETGSVVPRNGFEYEPSYTELASTSEIIQEFLWESAGGIGNQTFVVVQTGNEIYVARPNGHSISEAGYQLITTLEAIPGSPDPGTEYCQFASGRGYLFIVHPYCDPKYVKYDALTGLFTVSKYGIQIRDFAGVTTPGISTGDTVYPGNPQENKHKYNVYNQGWWQDALTDFGFPMNASDYWLATAGHYPKNSDVWWLYKDSDGFLTFQKYDSIGTGNTQAPKGHFILEAFFQDRSAVSGIPDIPVITSGYYRPKAIAFHAGRVFYAGVSGNQYSGNVYFSQILVGDNKFGMCYQDNDPTSENLSDLLPTDGGVVTIPEMGIVYKMVSVGVDLLIFASNGVWSITGSTGFGFSATDYSIKKLSTIRTLSDKSFVIVDGTPIWWNYEGIYVARMDPATTQMQITSMTDQTIRSFYREISPIAKLNAKGAYNPITKVIQWVYSSLSTDVKYFDKILNFNTLTGAFYPWDISTSSVYPKVYSILSTRGSGYLSSLSSFEESDSTVTIGLDPVSVASGYVTAGSETTAEFEIIPLSFKFKYMTKLVSALTFVEEGTGYIDFPTIEGGNTFRSFGITGYKIRGEGIRKTQSNFIVIYLDRVEGGSLYMRARRNYANDQETGKFTTSIQVYRDDPRFDVLQRRIKLLGTGRVAQFEFYSEGKPFSLVGWSAYETGNAGI